jgi:hypothetical protein
VAYLSNESGGQELYVREFPSGANKAQVSSQRASNPRWRRDGRELFYVEPARRALMTATVGAGKTFSAGTPVQLFVKESMPYYDVSNDGQRFLVFEKPPDGVLSIHVVQNWLAEFRK